MDREALERLQAVPAWPSLPEGGTARLAVGAIVALAVLACQLSVLLLRPAAALPEYPAVIVAFVVAVVLPGLILQGAVLSSHDTDFTTRLGVAPALGLAVAALPGIIALELHSSLQQFAVLLAVVSSTASGVALLFYPDRIADADSEAGPSRGHILLVAFLAITMAGILTTPFWASDSLAADGDSWTYLAYVKEFTDTDTLNAEEPFLGTGDPVNPRMRSNVWVLMESLISDTADVPPHDTVLQYLRPILVLVTALGVYALAKTLFRNTTVALLSMVFFLGYGFLDLAPHEGFGRHLFSRVSEDKVAAAFYLLPIALLFCTRFARAREASAFVGFSLVVIAMMIVHPVPIAFLAVAVASFGGVQALTERSFRPLGTTLLFLVPIALASIWPLVQRQLLMDAVPEVFGTGDDAILYRAEFRVVWLGFGLTMGNYHIIYHPLLLLALASISIVWWASRRETGNQMAVAVTIGAILVFACPLLATPLAEIMAPQTLWRVAWLIPVAPILGYVMYLGAERVIRLGPLARLRPDGVGRRVASAIAPGALAVVVLAVALLVQEPYGLVDDGAYYEWTTDKSVIPGTGESVFRAGIERLFSGTWRLDPYESDLFAYLDGHVPADSVILMEPSLLGYMMPAMLTDVYPVDPGGKIGLGDRRDTVRAFEEGLLGPREIDVAIDRWGVDYIVATEVGPANPPLLEMSRLEWMAGVGPYAVYEVHEDDAAATTR